MNDKIRYFDYNSTHVPIREIIESSFHEYFENYFNPSGSSKFSLACQSRIEKARSFFGSITKKNKNGFFFSSTGTESNYLLVSALASNLKNKLIITSPFEHPSVFAALKSFGFETIILNTDKTGKIDLNDLEEKLKVHLCPVILIYASNETGVIQPIKEACILTQKYGSYLFSDLMQAFGKIEIDFSLLTGFTFSGHKIGAGMGSSLTYVDPNFTKNLNFSIFSGGNQENSQRAGTENLQSIIAFHKSSEFQLTHLIEKNLRLDRFKKNIEAELKNLGVLVIAENSERIPSTTFAILPLNEIDFFMIGMENKNLLISNGASCKSRTRTVPESLLAMGYTKQEALRAIRISSGLFTTEEDVIFLNNGIYDVLKQL